MRLPKLFLPCALTLLASGCATTYYAGYRFDPRPAEVVLRGPATESESGVPPRALFRVAGVLRGDEEAGHGPEVEVDVRLENSGETDLALGEDALTLVAGDLTELGPMRREPDTALVAAPGASSKWKLFFALPEGRSPRDLALDGMNLRWELHNGELRATGSIGFKRSDPDYGGYGYGYGFYGWYPFYGYGGYYGYGFGHGYGEY